MELRRLKQLQEENRRPKKIGGDQALAIDAMKTIIEGKDYGSPKSGPRSEQ